MLFLQFCYDMDSITAIESEKMQLSFSKMLTDLVQAQNRRVPRDGFGGNNDFDFLTNIRTMYNNGSFNLSSGLRRFTTYYDGFIHNDCLCLYGKNFNHRVCKSLLNTDYSIVLETLETQGCFKERLRQARDSSIRYGRETVLRHSP